MHVYLKFPFWAPALPPHSLNIQIPTLLDHPCVTLLQHPPFPSFLLPMTTLPIPSLPFTHPTQSLFPPDAPNLSLPLSTLIPIPSPANAIYFQVFSVTVKV